MIRTGGIFVLGLALAIPFAVAAGPVVVQPARPSRLHHGLRFGRQGVRGAPRAHAHRATGGARRVDRRIPGDAGGHLASIRTKETEAAVELVLRDPAR